MNFIIILIVFLLFSGCQIKKKAKPFIFHQNPLFKENFSKSQCLINNNLWKYITKKLKIPIPNNKKINKQIQIYLKKQKYLKYTMLQAEPYMHLIVKKINDLTLPLEIALIPIIESRFNPNAISKAKATGIWQIIPLTAHLNGLKQNKWIDERKNFIKSTKVALNILKKINERFNGNWILTFAAYNCGENCVLNAIKKSKKFKLFKNFWFLNVPKETKNYVTKILALTKILKNHKKYSFVLPIINKKKSLTQINIKKKITLSEVSQFSKIPLKLIKSYNPDLNRFITPPYGPHKIILPKNKVKIFKKNLMQNKKNKFNISKKRKKKWS